MVNHHYNVHVSVIELQVQLLFVESILVHDQQWFVGIRTDRWTELQVIAF